MTHLQKILSLIPLYFISCTTSQVEDDFPKEEEQATIGFNAKVNSRALADINSVKTNGFSVWGGYEGGTEAVFDGDKIVFGTNDNYTTDKYWTYNIYNFYAVYPSTTTAEYDVTANTFTINDYNVKGTEDLLCASATHTYPVGGSTVSLTFKHLLTNVSINLKKDVANVDDAIIVTGVHLNGMNTQGDYDATSTPSIWINQDTPSYISVPNLSAALETNAATACATDLLVLPQTITENQITLYITYTYQQSGSTSIQSKSLTTTLPVSPAWEPGTKVNYSGTIHVDKNIVFATPTVESWGTEQAGGTIIIK